MKGGEKYMNKNAILLGGATLILGGLLLSPNVAEAYRGDPSVEGPDCTEERHEDMEQAFEDNDYQAWESLMQGKGRVTQVINEDNFAQFAEAHRLTEEGKTEEAGQIREELGLGLRNGSGQGFKGQGMGQGGNR